MSSKAPQGAAITGDPAGGLKIPVLAVVGVGLIGGSFAAALRRAGVVGRVLGRQLEGGRHTSAVLAPQEESPPYKRAGLPHP